jgi:y4mF family transcriptional regulator
MVCPALVPTPTARALGRVIRECRRRDGLTLVEAAGLVNVGVRFLSELENGKPTVRLDKLLKVLDAFGLELHLGPARWDGP